MRIVYIMNNIFLLILFLLVIYKPLTLVLSAPMLSVYSRLHRRRFLKNPWGGYQRYLINMLIQKRI